VAVSFGRSRRFGRLAFAFSLVLVVAGTPSIVHAQGFFDFLRSIFGVPRLPPPQQQIGPPPVQDRSPTREPRKVDPMHASYCVRLCDGRYFPLPGNSGAESQKQVCSAMCPAAKTEIYSGSGIEQATSPSGRPYTALANAFVYRDRLVDDCTCNGKDPTGVAKIEIEADPTLRHGDIVTTKEGQVVFRGDRRTPHRSSEFSPVQPQKQTSSTTRRSVSEARGRREGRAVSAPTDSSVPAPAQALGPASESGGKMRRVGPTN
jgi:hypothetical protein